MKFRNNIIERKKNKIFEVTLKFMNIMTAHFFLAVSHVPEFRKISFRDFLSLW